MVRPAAAFASHRFAVAQDRVGMKVGIDGIVLAAAAGRELLGRRRGGGSTRLRARPWLALDVGCGCGIVALLLRQAACAAGQAARITALDIDAAAAAQARENVASSPWPADIDVLLTSLQQFAGSAPPAAGAGAGSAAAAAGHGPFDLIVSNPPYYPRPPPHVQRHSAANRASQLSSSSSSSELWPESRAHARFREYLPPLDLLSGAASLLSPHGSFWCVYPASEEKLLLDAAEAGAAACVRSEIRNLVPLDRSRN